MSSGLPKDAKERKTYPIGSGLIDYFPAACAYVAHVSYVGNEQHNPGQPLHWDRSKSSDESDALMRHFSERNGVDSDGLLHAGKMAWRAMAFLQKKLEADQSGPIIGKFIEPSACEQSVADPGFCLLHQVYLDDRNICPSDPDSIMYQWWLGYKDAAFRTRMAKEAELCT